MADKSKPKASEDRVESTAQAAPDTGPASGSETGKQLYRPELAR